MPHEASSGVLSRPRVLLCGRIRRGWLAASFLVLAAVSARAGDDPGEKAFCSDLEKIRATLASGRPAGGLPRIVSLLAAHEDRDYARALRSDVEDLAARLAFAAAHPPPAAKDVVRGELLSYTSSPSRIRIAYTPHENDFEVEGQLLIHPAAFLGPFSVEVTGGAYPGDVDAVPMVSFGLVEHEKTRRNQSYQVVFGTPAYNDGDVQRWRPAALVHSDGDQQKVLQEKETTPAKAGAPYKLVVKVGDTRFSASINGKTIGTAVKSSDVFGHLVIECSGWKRILLEGAIEPSFIQGRIDEVLQGHRARFAAAFQVKDHLPAWLYRAAPRAAGAPEEAPASLEESLFPVPPPAAFRVPALAAMIDLLAGRYDAVLTFVEKLRQAGGPEAVCTWFLAQVHEERSELTPALGALERTVELAPAFVPARVLRGRVLHRLGRRDEAKAALLEAAAARPTDAEMLEEIGFLLLLQDAADAARSLVEGAASRGVSSAHLEALARVLVKSGRGPDWPRTYEHKSLNYHVVSDMDAQVCREAALVLEEGLSTYKSQVGDLSRTGSRTFRVYLFSGPAGFEAYVKEVDLLEQGGHENAAGLYSPLLKQLLIWNLPSREEMLRTVRHEGFHQYLDRLLPDAPTWLDEGLAVYYENLERVGGKPQYGAVRHDLVQELGKQDLVPPREFLFQRPKEFYAGSHASYAQAWLVVHTLRHTSIENRELFRTLLERLAKEPPFDVLRDLMTPERLAKLEKDMAAHLGTLSAGR